MAGSIPTRLLAVSSHDGGKTWSAPIIGDYQGVSADNLFVHPIWNDTRTGNQEVFTAAIPSAQP